MSKKVWTASEMGKKGIKRRIERATTEQVREWCRKAGVASGKARKKRARLSRLNK